MKMILVVEDDADIREIICAMLKEEGLSSVGAGNGKIALDYLTSSAPKPNLILLDLMMPVMSGYELVGELKAAGITVPIVILSAVTENVSRLGAKAHIQKPFEFSKLVKVIRAHAL